MRRSENGRSEFDLLSGTVLSRYTHGGSALHTLDARVKILLGVLLIASSVAAAAVSAQALLLAAVCAGFLAAGVKPGQGLKPLVPVMPFVLALAVIQVFAVPRLHEGARLLWQRGVLKVTDRSLLGGILLVARFGVIVWGMSLLSAVTKASDLTAGIEHLLRPLQRVGIPANEFSMALGISVRFLPVLTEEASRLMRAQASRGADFGYHKRNFIKKLVRMLPLLVPLFLTSLRRAQNLIEAMESRCYAGGRGRTYLNRPRAKRGDVIALAAAFCVSAAAVFLYRSGADWSVWGLLRKIFERTT